MLAWIATIGLRAKVLGLAALAVLALVGSLWARMRIASARAAKWKSQAERLEATHNLERDIALRREKLAERQMKLRAEIAEREGRDFFDGGWGP